MPIFGARTTLNKPFSGILGPSSLMKKSMLSSVPRPEVKWTLFFAKNGGKNDFSMKTRNLLKSKAPKRCEKAWKLSS